MVETKKYEDRVYYCKKCDRFTDVFYVYDKVDTGGRPKSYCYKCSDEALISSYIEVRII